MSSTLVLTTGTDVTTARRRRTVRAAAVIAALVATAAAVGAGAAPANAAPGVFPTDGSAWTAIVETAASAPFSATLQSVWSELSALPNSNRVHNVQILKELATHNMG